MSAFDDATVAAGLRRLKGQVCTPSGFDRALVREIKDRDLARFHEWPSGHWALTRRGQNFLAEQNDVG